VQNTANTEPNDLSSPLQEKSPIPFGQGRQKESLDDADEELGDDERNGRREIIPSVFSNSRNIQEKSMLSYN
jgi:hypothetical protein